MRLWAMLRARLRSALFPGRREDDLAEEVRLHLDQETAHWIAHGIDPVEARRRAQHQFGNVESVKEASREARGTAVWDHFVRDTRHAARRLVHDWRFSLPAILLLALGIGVTTAVFSVVNAALVRSAPFRDSERLVDLYQNTRDGGPGLNTYPVFEDIAATTTVFAGAMTTTVPIQVEFRDRGGPVRRGVAEYASASYPDVLGLRPALGRWFTPDEDRRGVPLVAVVGHETWRARFNGDPAVLGRTIYVQGAAVTIVGVAPAGYRGTVDIGLVTDFWLPVSSALGSLTTVRRAAESPFLVKARLRDGVTLAQARAAMDALGRRLAAQYPDDDPGRGISVFATDEVRVHPQMDTLLSVIASLLLAVVGLVLAIACSNLATLLLVRAAARAKEVSIRLAIGATRWQIVRHLLTESVLLSLVGGFCGSLLAWWLIRWLHTVDLPVTVDVGVDATVLGFALLLSVFTGVLFGLAPALTATRLDLLSVIREDGQTRASGHRWFTLRNGLVVFQVTASVVLLTTTGAFQQMGAAARAQRIGFAVQGVAWIQTDARYSGYSEERAGAVYDALRRRAARLPGVASVSLIQGPPMESATQAVVIEGATRGDRTVNVSRMWAGPGFFDVMGIPILFGRAIDERDRRGSPLVAVVSESMARTYLGGINAVGRRFRLDRQADWIQVIGVVRDTGTNDRGGDLVDGMPEAYFRPVQQSAPPAAAVGPASGAASTLVARTSGDPAVLVRELQRELLALDPSLPVLSASTMAQQLDLSLAVPRAIALALGALGALGLVLAGVGLYAVIAFVVARRSREIGIRMALGARSGDVVRDVARDVAALLGVSAGVGLGCALGVIFAMRAFSNVGGGAGDISIYPPSVDPLQLGAIAAFVILVGLLAAFVPSRRAARISPLAALRHE